ncbi:MAG: 4-hydroxy-3-methylbut-2-enyl diphosphate reductase [Bacteroides sp.]|nr:4-hydroxy-3-methylbut-2-enyl diphosphate reductase [Lachnospiraceae bacterium]MCM1332234.1 4-hydroxy-3-methylbut-2-enyl diphosphate reductase [Bacteroides sp.]MCM1389233.1 4-hydroxy-3-methylbut-2-enyl diphosphate reductase [Bacteroides sp.]
MIRIEIDKDSGFCNGVVSAIRKAEDELDRTGTLYCLGDIVHNSDEVERLRQRGLVTITHEELSKLHGVKVLLRAHGEPPSTYEIARKNDITIIDATCPVVLHLQKRIRESYDKRSGKETIVIYGKRGHAEVNGLVGQTNGEAIVVEEISGLEKLDYDNDIVLYSQTTKSLQGLSEMISAIESKKSPDTNFRYYDTICRQVANRVPKLREFASAHDLILFVSGKKSSNGKILFGECADVNSNTHLISNPDEIEPSWLNGVESIGICGATSTPRWLMENVKEHLLKITRDE